MKMLIGIFILATVLFPERPKAQSDEAQQLLLNVEKLSQFRTILKNMKKGYEILSKGYNRIKDISKGSFNIHDAFLDGLLIVGPTVRNYKKVADIIVCQASIVTCETTSTPARTTSIGSAGKTDRCAHAGTPCRCASAVIAPTSSGDRSA